ncbi:hypothetical protein SAMN05519104_8105 [Rhizobiales bacterium GAS188]|nr:hypothetical protein SAMN05519104_8105 [Rhizobiales bacterium GAS188]
MPTGPKASSAHRVIGNAMKTNDTKLTLWTLAGLAAFFLLVWAIMMLIRS